MDVKKVVNEKYGAAALRISSGPGLANCPAAAAIPANVYDSLQKELLPEDFVSASMGCGNPTALADLKPGEIVLDLGSGGGIDVLLSARRVLPGGWACGLEMTDQMLSLARENQKKAGVRNAEFLKGEMENIPLRDGSVDVVISNCAINLSVDKDEVMREAFRVLKPGGRFAVCDVVTRGESPAAIKKSVLLWVGCIAGALDEEEYGDTLAAAGFLEIEIEPVRIFTAAEAFSFLLEDGWKFRDGLNPGDGSFLSAFIRARKPF